MRACWRCPRTLIKSATVGPPGDDTQAELHVKPDGDLSPPVRSLVRYSFNPLGFYTKTDPLERETLAECHCPDTSCGPETETQRQLCFFLYFELKTIGPEDPLCGRVLRARCLSLSTRRAVTTEESPVGQASREAAPP